MTGHRRKREKIFNTSVKSERERRAIYLQVIMNLRTANDSLQLLQTVMGINYLAETRTVIQFALLLIVSRTE